MAACRPSLKKLLGRAELGYSSLSHTAKIDLQTNYFVNYEAILLHVSARKL
jgi:hypothetical protein